MGSQTKRVRYLFDSRGNRQAMIDHDGGRFTYSYDVVNRLTSVINPQGERTSYSYDDAGRRTVKKLANGTRASFAYDPAGNLTKLYNLKSDGSVISSFDYSHDKVGNRTAVLEADGSLVTWTYDATYQLTGEHRTGTSPYRDTYTYDPTGNRTLKNHDGARTTSTYDAANQLRYSEDVSGRTTYTFDADGNQQIVLEPTGDRTTYVWDYENRMTSLQLPSGIRNTMAYEPEGLRVKLQESTGTKKFVWDEQNYLAETDGSNDTQVVYTNEPRRYGNLVSQRRLSAGVWTPHWYHFDAIGSTRELTTSGQVVSDTQLYDAFGLVVSETGGTPIVLQYLGRVGYLWDAQIAAFYDRRRVLQPVQGRWLSAMFSNLQFPFLQWPNPYIYRINVYVAPVSAPPARDPRWDAAKCMVHCMDRNGHNRFIGSMIASDFFYHFDRNKYDPKTGNTPKPWHTGVGIAIHLVLNDVGKTDPCCCDAYRFIQVEWNSDDKVWGVDGGSPECPYYGCNPTSEGSGPPPSDTVKDNYPPSVVKKAGEVDASLYDRPYNPFLPMDFFNAYRQEFVTCAVCQRGTADTILLSCMRWGWKSDIRDHVRQPPKALGPICVSGDDIIDFYLREPLRRDNPIYHYEAPTETPSCTC